MKTPYDILGVPRNADTAKIRAALRTAAKAHHPDVNAGDRAAEQRLKAVIAAYELLRNPQQRAAYDQVQRQRRRHNVRRLATTTLTTAMLVGCTVALVVQQSSMQVALAPEASAAAAEASGAGKNAQAYPAVAVSHRHRKETEQASHEDGRSVGRDPTGTDHGASRRTELEDNNSHPSPAQPQQQALATLGDGQQSGYDRGTKTAPSSQLSGPELARAERLFAQGEKRMADGNVGAARLFFQSAADLGLAAAALRLAATYDPHEVQRLKVHSVMPDRALARKWYERARDLGAPEGGELLAKLAN
jgi:curved DNA-binding protein CbpA